MKCKWNMTNLGPLFILWCWEPFEGGRNINPRSQCSRISLTWFKENPWLHSNKLWYYIGIHRNTDNKENSEKLLPTVFPFRTELSPFEQRWIANSPHALMINCGASQVLKHSLLAGIRESLKTERTVPFCHVSESAPTSFYRYIKDCFNEKKLITICFKFIYKLFEWWKSHYRPEVL